jgi:hypothetical protein
VSDIRLDPGNAYEAIDRLGRRLRAGERPALEAGGKVVKGRAKELVPVDTGALKADIDVRPDPPDGVRVGTENIEYAAKVERDKAYLRPAADETQPQQRRAIADELRRRILRL